MSGGSPGFGDTLRLNSPPPEIRTSRSTTT